MRKVETKRIPTKWVSIIPEEQTLSIGSFIWSNLQNKWIYPPETVEQLMLWAWNNWKAYILESDNACVSSREGVFVSTCSWHFQSWVQWTLLKEESGKSKIRLSSPLWQTILPLDHDDRICLSIYCDVHFVGGDGWWKAGNDGAAALVDVDGAEWSIQNQKFLPKCVEQSPIVEVIPQAVREVRVHSNRPLNNRIHLWKIHAIKCKQASCLFFIFM